MDNFVAQQRADGTKDSTGRFTLSPDLAREKLRDYQLEHPGSYILKMVQAAIRSGAPQILVQAGRRELSLRFTTEDPKLSEPQRILEAFEEFQNLPDSSLRHLILGLNAALSDSSISEVRWESPQGGLLMDSEKIEGVPISSSGYGLRVRKNTTLFKWFLGTSFLNEIVHLNIRCLYAPSRILVDKRVVNSSNPERFGPYSQDQFGFQSPAYLFEAYSATRGSLHYSLRLDCYEQHGEYYLLKERTKTVRHPESLLSFRPGCVSQMECKMALGVPSDTRASSQLHLYKDGVKLETLQGLELGHPSIIVHADASDCQVDLSEFRVVQSRVFHELLEEVRAFVRERTESLTLELLQKTLERGGMSPACVKRRSPYFYFWLQKHHFKKAASMLELVENNLLHPELLLNPEIPEKKIQAARELHKDHLPEEELIVALYDDTLSGNATLGFVITDNRICWCNTLSRPEYLLWRRFCDSELSRNKNKVLLMGTEIDFVLKKELVEPMESFLTQVKQLPHPPLPGQELSPLQEELIKLGLRHLKKSKNVYYHPHFDESKLKEFKKAVSKKVPIENEEILIYYDDTFFGSGDNGFVITENRIIWKNILTAPGAWKWYQIEAEKIKKVPQGVSFGLDDHVSVCTPGFESSVADFFKALANLGEGIESDVLLALESKSLIVDDQALPE